MSEEYLNIAQLPPDPSFGLMADFNADPHPNKVSLIAGAYRDENGQPWVLPCVKAAKERLRDTANHEYLPITGSPTLRQLARKLVFGPEQSSTMNITTVQSVSGTGANHLAAVFIATHLKPKHVFIPDPTWVNHKSMWSVAAPSVTQKEYPYYSYSTRSINFDGMISSLEESALPNDVMILQACAHNPTGMDFTREQWSQLAEVVKRKRVFALFDNAYQGFATGDLDGDAWAIRHFCDVLFSGPGSDHPGLFVAQSFSKNFGLYGERVGALHLVIPQRLSSRGAMTQLSALVRSEYSNPPRYGAGIVETVLNDSGLIAQWQKDLDTMSSRIKQMRRLLRAKLEERNAPADWSHIEQEIGMFSMTGLNRDQVTLLREQHHVYLMPSGRASICGLTEGNAGYVADSICSVLADTSK